MSARSLNCRPSTQLIQQVLNSKKNYEQRTLTECGEVFSAQVQLSVATILYCIHTTSIIVEKMNIASTSSWYTSGCSLMEAMSAAVIPCYIGDRSQSELCVFNWADIATFIQCMEGLVTSMTLSYMTKIPVR